MTEPKRPGAFARSALLRPARELYNFDAREWPGNTVEAFHAWVAGRRRYACANPGSLGGWGFMKTFEGEVGRHIAAGLPVPQVEPCSADDLDTLTEDDPRLPGGGE